ncbi:glycosyltransferase family 39 protein [Candidatus Woesearchaeota archaeon]|nr:glycosyltransferase family 39 protein [Candidatus Woesearchaeota archaeon]
MRKSIYILFTIFLLAIAVRLFFAFQTPYFTNNDSYFHIRQIEHIRDTGFPLFNDDLSYGGRKYIFLPIFHYLLAFFALFMPILFTVKIIPAILAATTILLVYLIVKRFTKKEEVAILTAFISAFIPIFFKETINVLSLYSLTIPLTLLLLYFFMDISSKGSAMLYVLVFIIFLFTKPTIMLIIASFMIYFIIIKIESLPLGKAEMEIAIFSLIFSLWFYLLIYKNAFYNHSYAFLWHNVPIKYFTDYFQQISILQAIYQIGIIPFFCGIYIISSFMFKKKDKAMYLLISIVITTTILMWFKLIELNLALIYLSIFLILLFAKFLDIFLEYISQTKLNHYYDYIIGIIIIIFLVTSCIPSFQFAVANVATATKQYEVNTLLMLFATSPQDATILGSVDDGHFITYFSNRKTVADGNFLLIDNINERINDVDAIFTAYSKIKASELLDKYSVDYIFLSENTKQQYNLSDLRFIDEKCFDKIDEYNVTVYKNKCKVTIE